MTDELDANAAPLAGFLVLDVSRMLPGAVLARMLVDLGARVIKVEDPAMGDLMRHAPPFVAGTGAGFCALLRGCESIAIDLRSEHGTAVFRELTLRADVVVESFRPGALAAWGLSIESLCAASPRLITCSLSGFGGAARWQRQAAHDLNFIGLAGLLERLGGAVPGIQLADVAGGLLAATAIVAALLRRERSGRGARIDQPLAAAPLPFLAWAWADAAAGGAGVGETILAGHCAAYRTYECADGRSVAVGALEPKLWEELVRLLELPHLAASGLFIGSEGAATTAEVAARFRSQPRDHWLEVASARHLPVTAVNHAEAARQLPLWAEAGLCEQLPIGDGGSATVVGPFIPSLGRTPAAPAPRLGEHTAAVLTEFGIKG